MLHQGVTLLQKLLAVNQVLQHIRLCYKLFFTIIKIDNFVLYIKRDIPTVTEKHLSSTLHICHSTIFVATSKSRKSI